MYGAPHLSELSKSPYILIHYMNELAKKPKLAYRSKTLDLKIN